MENSRREKDYKETFLSIEDFDILNDIKKVRNMNHQSMDTIIKSLDLLLEMFNRNNISKTVKEKALGQFFLICSKYRLRSYKYPQFKNSGKYQYDHSLLISFVDDYISTITSKDIKLMKSFKKRMEVTLLTKKHFKTKLYHNIAIKIYQQFISMISSNQNVVMMDPRSEYTPVNKQQQYIQVNQMNVNEQPLLNMNNMQMHIEN
jgi:hypothetical protein